jgi:hypothetical protein
VRDTPFHPCMLHTAPQDTISSSNVMSPRLFKCCADAECLTPRQAHCAIDTQRGGSPQCPLCSHLPTHGRVKQWSGAILILASTSMFSSNLTQQLPCNAHLLLTLVLKCSVALRCSKKLYPQTLHVDRPTVFRGATPFHSTHLRDTICDSAGFERERAQGACQTGYAVCIEPNWELDEAHEENAL